MKLAIIDETAITLKKLQREYGIPPVLFCTYNVEYLVASIMAVYVTEGKKPPKALENFILKTMPKVKAELEETRLKQLTQLNTEGRC